MFAGGGKEVFRGAVTVEEPSGKLPRRKRRHVAKE